MPKNVTGQWSPDTRLLMSASSGLLAVLRPTASAAQVSVVEISFSELLSSSSSAVSPIKAALSSEETIDVQLQSSVHHFVRTPNGRGLLAVTESDEIGVWYKERMGKVPKGTAPPPRALAGKGHWRQEVPPKTSAIFAKGRAIVFYTEHEGEGRITLQHLDRDATSPTPPVLLPDFELDLGDEIAVLLAVSDIDDGHSGRGRRTQKAIIIAASRQGHAWVWKMDSSLMSTASADTHVDDAPEVKLLSHHVLSVEGGEPQMILPVDPMGWHQSVIDWKTNTPLQDMILTVSKDGVLEFWSPELGHHFEGERPHPERVNGNRSEQKGSAIGEPWTRTGVVRTGKKNVSRARCSSRKKTVLICDRPEGSEMTIWDSKVSEFSTGLELTHTFPAGQAVQDLDWTTTSDLQSVLAVGFAHSVVLVCEQRLSYTEFTPGWAPFLTINLQQYTSIPISDSVWLAGGSLAIGAGNQIYLFSRFIDKETPIPSPAASARNVALHAEEAEDIFQLIAWQNGPLWDYHPTVLAQCLLWDKIDLVKSILVNLAKSLHEAEENGKTRLTLDRLDPSSFITATAGPTRTSTASPTRRYDSLFDAAPVVSDEDEEDFSDRLVQSLQNDLQGSVSLALSPSEKIQLAAVARATLEVERERRSLDKCGLRYLLSIRMAVNRSGGALSGTATPVESHAHGIQAQPSRISFRNFVWATHSESQDMLLTAATQSCANAKMLWSDAKRLGVFLWLKSNEVLKSQLEIIARNRFMLDEDRDPTSCSLIFFALGKKKVVHGLWKQAPGHKEQPLMMKFLANDFELDRWKTAAVKNAYALLSRQRFEYAAAFFMLGGCPKDAINICVRQLNDWQLAYALARVVEGGTDGPLVKWVVEDTVVPLAMAGGHRWLATWAFWTLGRRDLAVRVLISPMDEVASAWSVDKVIRVGNPENDDPSLLLLFQHLKSKSLQTAKGTSEIPEKTEFDFVLHNARVFFRMGCHSLCLDLLHSWSFERPFFPSKRASSRMTTPGMTVPGTPTGEKPRRPSLSTTGSSSVIRPAPRRPSFMLSGHMRRESMVMDMDVLAEGASEPATRAASPVLGDRQSAVNGINGEVEVDDGQAHRDEKSTRLDKEEEKEPAVEEKPKKMGNLMKELKQDVQQGAMEFDMNSFF